MGRPKIPVETHYIPVPWTGCWLWLGNIGVQGYGTTTGPKKAHREVYRAVFGEIPEGLVVCHKCDVRACINPDHLFLGTVGDNNRDRDDKNRNAKGSRMAAAKLHEAQINQIRNDPRSSSAIAREFGVTPRVIILVKNRQSWTHVAEAGA